MIFIITVVILLFLIFHYLVKPELINSQKNQKPGNKSTKRFIPIQIDVYQTSNKKASSNNPPIEVLPPPELLHFNLLTEIPESEQAVVDKIVEITQSMPRPHPMLKALTQEIENSDKLYGLVKSDPEIAAKILQSVNSASFYLTQKITRLNQALLYMGTNMVKNIALQCIITTPPRPMDKELSIVFKKIWSYGFLASSLTFLFAKNLNIANADELATQTLLSYIGNIAIVSYKPELAYCFLQNRSLFERVQMEQSELGVNSAMVGGALAASWNLPQELVAGIQNHLIPLGVPPEQCELPQEYLRDIVLCYMCCRAAEIIFKEDLQDIADVHLLNQEQMDLFYLPEYIHVTGLQQFLSLQQKPTFRNEMNKLIQRVNNPEEEKNDTLI